LYHEDTTAGVWLANESTIAAPTLELTACSQVMPATVKATVATEDGAVPFVGETLGVSEDEYVK
jgi:hypothetical protein